MFDREIYVSRRRTLLEKMSAGTENNGIAIFLGNAEAPQNYRGNDYKFRQDSSFLYYWGIDEPGFAAILDLDSGDECIFGDDVDIDDIIWMGPQESVASKAARVGANISAPYAEFDKAVLKAKSQGRKIHFLPASRYYNTLKLSLLLGTSPEAVRTVAAMEAPVAGGM